jgi:hypothetical protein
MVMSMRWYQSVDSSLRGADWITLDWFPEYFTKPDGASALSVIELFADCPTPPKKGASR